MSDLFLEEQRERFREASRDRLAEMRVLLDAPDVDAVRKLARHFHAFAGLGATYGFRQISELGDDGEGSILPLVRSGEAPARQTVDRWRELCARIGEALLSGERITLQPPSPQTGVSVPRKILAVDDDATHGVLLAHVLRNAGFDVVICADLELFGGMFSAFPADLLLVDIHLGDRDRGGYELVERVRARERFRALPVIFVSADREVEPGSNDPHLVKPVDWTLLLSLIRSVLQGPPQCGPPDASSKSSPTPTADD